MFSRGSSVVRWDTGPNAHVRISSNVFHWKMRELHRTAMARSMKFHNVHKTTAHGQRADSARTACPALSRAARALWCLFPLCLCQTATIIIWLKAPRPVPSFVLAWLECGARLSQTPMSHGTRLRAKSTPQTRQTRDLQRPDPWGRCAPMGPGVNDEKQNTCFCETEKSCTNFVKFIADASVLTTAVNARWPTYLT